MAATEIQRNKRVCVTVCVFVSCVCSLMSPPPAAACRMALGDTCIKTNVSVGFMFKWKAISTDKRNLLFKCLHA